MIDMKKRAELVQEICADYLKRCEAQGVDESAICMGFMVAMALRSLADNVGTDKTLKIITTIMGRLIEDDPEFMAKIQADGGVLHV